MSERARSQASSPAAMTSARAPAAAAALTAVLGVAAACWLVTARQMNGMAMGTMTPTV